jgi:hypothetical protein
MVLLLRVSKPCSIEGGQQGRGDVKLEPIVSTPAQRKANEKDNDRKVQLLRRFFQMVFLTFHVSIGILV